MATANKNKTAAAAAAAKTALATSPGDPAPGMRQVLQVISKRDGFRRAGREWHGTSHVPLDELTRAQYEQLTTEPLLVTQLLEVPEEQAGELTAKASRPTTDTHRSDRRKPARQPPASRGWITGVHGQAPANRTPPWPTSRPQNLQSAQVPANWPSSPARMPSP